MLLYQGIQYTQYEYNSICNTTERCVDVSIIVGYRIEIFDITKHVRYDISKHRELSTVRYVVSNVFRRPSPRPPCIERVLPYIPSSPVFFMQMLNETLDVSNIEIVSISFYAEMLFDG